MLVPLDYAKLIYMQPRYARTNNKAPNRMQKQREFRSGCSRSKHQQVSTYEGQLLEDAHSHLKESKGIVRPPSVCSNHPKWPTFLNSTTVAIRFPRDFWKDQTASLHAGRSQCDLSKECDCPLSGCISAMLFSFPRSLGYCIFVIISSKFNQHQVKWQTAPSDTNVPPLQSQFFPAAPPRDWNTDLSVQPQPLQAMSPP